MKTFTLRSLRLCVTFLVLTIAANAQIPSPKDTLGFTPGDDRKLASWASIVDYFKKLDAASDRMIFEEIGKTTMGAPFVYATISSPENLKNLDKYKDINQKLADPRWEFTSSSMPQSRVKRYISEGKTIVLITCGIHSTEVGSTLSSTLIAHKLASSDDPEIKKILENTIILLVPSLNPDGVDIVKNWYDKTLGTPYEGTSPPELYHKYVGHDNNRDWYAFTQVETQLTVDKIHNVWHPQIVHDIHQQGQNGARLFLPPYMQPVEPNVPKQIVEGYTELGNAMAADLRKKGLEGITTNTTYDAWTPARAYSHYHGGVRILSETASARLATPITVNFDDSKSDAFRRSNPTAEAVTLTPFAKTESDKFGPVWKGGEWKLRNITDYMTTAAFSLLNHAADNRERWLSRFYEIGKEAVRPRKDGELQGFVIIPKEVYKTSSRSYYKHMDDGTRSLLNLLEGGGVEIYDLRPAQGGKGKYPEETVFVPLAQPNGSFAKALLEKQTYPNLLNETGQPISPYDVTAHTLPLLMGVNVKETSSFMKSKSPHPIRHKLEIFVADPGTADVSKHDLKVIDVQDTATLFQSPVPSMDEGWTRWIFEKWQYKNYASISPDLIRDGKFTFPTGHDCSKSKPYTVCIKDFRATSIIFPDQSPNQILNGYAKGSMPDEYTDGVGKEGVENLKKFVEAGGTLVFLNRASNFAIEQFNLPVKDVTRGLARKDFYIPGSILRTELDLTHPIAKGMPQQSIAWFEQSPAFEIVEVTPLGVQNGADGTAKAVTLTHRVIARYPSDPKQILLSGWALGAEKIAGKAALVEFTIGKGKIVLFGFRPQYRGQSLATFPLLFNAISR